MKKLQFFILLFIVFITTIARADEGMWIPMLLGKYTIADMQKKGFHLTAKDIYDINHASMKDAVLIFGRGCTGEIVSNQGLVFTNHHCGYSSIQSVSSVEHDYLTDGFWAKKITDEIPIAGLTVTFLERIEDVTSKVLTNVKPSDTEQEREEKIKANSDALIKANDANGIFDIKIKPFYYGNAYYMFVYKIYRDIRLVGAPPSAIGKFGGDTDNWMWPRHTGDFSVFRIYADKAGNPAKYSPQNIPLKPKKHFKISLKGFKKDDFTMVMGYPGTTQEYLPSYAIEVITQTKNPISIDLRRHILDTMDKYMKTNDKVRIQYAAKYAGIANYWKKWIGENMGIDRVNGLQRKQNFEKQFTQWVAQSNNQKQYASLLPHYKTIYHDIKPLVAVRQYIIEGLLAPNLMSLTRNFSLLKDWDKKTDEEKNKIQKLLQSRAKRFFKDFYLPIDKEIFEMVLQQYFEKVDKQYQFAPFTEFKTNDDATQYVKSLLEHSIATDSSKLYPLLNDLSSQNITTLLNDPIYQFRNAIIDFYLTHIQPQYSQFQAQLDSLNRLYMSAQIEFYKDKKRLSPDANFTMRVAYGKIGGYEPRDGVVYKYQTYLSGIIEKGKMGVYDYIVPKRLAQLYKNKDFGPYGENNRLPVCFLASNHTTGGNSGSPVFNADGELIGINFDRNWEGTMSDLIYDTSICRNIVVDIRYVLFVIDKYAETHRLIEELDLVKK